MATGRRLFALTTVAVLIAISGRAVGPAKAQVPTPTFYMYNTIPGNPFPPKAPGWAATANAVVVEGLGVLGPCAYNEDRIKYATVDFINHSLQTVTEISPQSYCGTVDQYVALMQRIRDYVETYAINPGRYWAGFMLDEEPGFGLTRDQLLTLNDQAYLVMYQTPGMSYWFTENQPNGWVLSDYNAIQDSSWAAPQVYSTQMANAVNDECTTYFMCLNLVTVNASSASATWKNYLYVTNLIKACYGSPPVCQGPWQNAQWGGRGFVNEWRNG
jgi:hypothetical protein